jgi:hypothetical protein
MAKELLPESIRLDNKPLEGMMKICKLEGVEVAYEELGQGWPILFLHS